MASAVEQPKAVDITGRWVLLSTIMASSMGFISGSALNVAQDALADTLGASARDLLLIFSGYDVLLAALILVGGSLGDHYGRKRIFGYGIWLFILGSVACGFAPNVNVLIAARVVQGVGGAMMVPGSLAIISAYFSDDERGGAIGLWSAFTAVTTVSAPILGGFLADPELWSTFLPQEVANQMWRGVFFINVPLAAVALYALYTHVPESRDDEAPDKLDIIGSVLATLGLGAMTYGFIDAGGSGFNTLNTSILVAGLVLLVVFVIWEGYNDHPMMPLALFRSPIFTGANLLTVFLYAGLIGALYFFSLFLLQAQNYPERWAGFATLPFSVLLILMSRQSGKIADRIGPRIPLTVGPAIVGVGFALLAVPGLSEGPSEYWTTYFPGMIGVGLGMGIAVAPLTTAVMGSVPQHQSGTASGINNAASRTAGVLARAIIGAIVLIQFSAVMNGRISDLDLSAADTEAILAQTSELGNVVVPESLAEEQASQVREAVRLSFLAVFRTSMYIGAGLAWLSAIFAWFTLRTRPEEARALVREQLATEGS